MSDSPYSAGDLAVCAAIQRKHASTYALATRLFPARERADTQVFYAFVRTADDIVDEPTDPDPAAVRREFEAWVDRWRAAYDGATSNDPVIRASAGLFRIRGIPLADAEAFLGAMRRDIDCTRYQSYDSLMQDYVYGSAAVIGEVMCRLCNVSDPSALAGARALGEAMQLTNFLRDVRADLLQRGRLYLALEDLERFGVSEADIRAGLVTPAFRSLVQAYVARARALYAHADEALPLLPSHARKAVRLSRLLYAGILDRITAQNEDVFSRRASVSTSRKFLTAAAVLAGA